MRLWLEHNGGHKWNLTIDRRAKRYIDRRIPKNYKSNINRRIEGLKDDPYPTNPELNVVKLGNTEKAYRLRVSNYRILYEIIEHERTIHIYQIGSRGNVYDSIDYSEDDRTLLADTYCHRSIPLTPIQRMAARLAQQDSL